MKSLIVLTIALLAGLAVGLLALAFADVPDRTTPEGIPDMHDRALDPDASGF